MPRAQHVERLTEWWCGPRARTAPPKLENHLHTNHRKRPPLRHTDSVSPLAFVPRWCSPVLLFCCHEMIFLTFFKTLEGKELTVELKNDLVLVGTLLSVDQFLNFKLGDVRVVEKERFPQLMAVRTIFIRGSVIRYVHVPPEAVDTALLQDAARKEAMEAARPSAPGGPVKK